MSLKRWSARRDANEAAIVDALRTVGAGVIRLSQTGVPDLLVLFRGRVHLLEVKRAKARGQGAGRATMAQEQLAAQGWPVSVTRTTDEALRAVGAIY